MRRQIAASNRDKRADRDKGGYAVANIWGTRIKSEIVEGRRESWRNVAVFRKMDHRERIHQTRGCYKTATSRQDSWIYPPPAAFNSCECGLTVRPQVSKAN